MYPSLRFVGENPSDAEVQVEKMYILSLKQTIYNILTLTGLGCSRQENYTKMFLPLEIVGQEIKYLPVSVTLHYYLS